MAIPFSSVPLQSDLHAFIKSPLSARDNKADPPPAEMTVDPTSDLNALGGQGGPFSPTSINYVVANIGGRKMLWALNNDQSWCVPSKSGGSIAAGASDSVLISLGSGANQLAIDAYVAILGFKNLSSGLGDTDRHVNLQVVAAAELSVVPSTGLTGTYFRTLGIDPSPFFIDYTLRNLGAATLDWSGTFENVKFNGSGDPPYNGINKWITVSPKTGSLGGSSSQVARVQYGPQFAGLDVGVWTGDVVFRNLTNGRGDTTRSVTLTVVA